MTYFVRDQHRVFVNYHCHVWVRYIEASKIKVACMSLLPLSIDLRRLFYFIMFYFKLANGAMVKWWMVKWCNGEIKISIDRFFLTNIESVHLFYFKHNIFAADKAIHNFQYLITNNKDSNQVYVIKPINHRKKGLYQVSAGFCEVDLDSDLICLASEISGNPIL